MSGTTKPHKRYTREDDFISERLRDSWTPYKSIESLDKRIKLATLWDHRYDSGVEKDET